MFKQTISAIALSVTLGIVPVFPVMADGLAGAYLAARNASNAFDFKTALQYFTQALARDPNNAGLMENTIVAFIGTGDIKGAVPIARRLNDINAGSQISNLLMLAEAAKNDKFADAFDILAEGETVGPLVDGLVLAWLQVGQGEMSDAIETFDKISEGAGLRTFGLYHKALALALVGDLEGSNEILSGETGVSLPVTRRGIIAHIEVLSQLERNEDALKLIKAIFGTDLDPGLEDIHTRLTAGETIPFTTVLSAKDGVSEVYYSVAGALSGEAADSYTLLYTRIAEYLRPDHIDAMLLSAQLLEKLDQYELATEAYDRIPRGDTAFHSAELGRAEALRRSGNTDAAIEVLQQLSESHADQANVHVALGDLFRRLDRHEEASRAYDLAVSNSGEPRSSQWALYFARGITNERIGDWGKAEADFRKALELQPDQPQVLNYLGYSFVEMKLNMDEALDMIERAVKARPDDGYITDSLGWVLYRLGRYDEAVAHMERAAELAPVDPIVNDHLGDVFWAVGRQREAEFQWYRALSFEPEDVDATRIRRKLEVGLDIVLEEEGGDPILVSNDG